MLGPIRLDSRPSSYWRLYFAIIEAAADWREAPWYGPWNIAIHQLFQDFCPPPFVTVTYPQHPVTKDIDSVTPEDDESEDDNSDYEVEGEQKKEDDDDGVCLPFSTKYLLNYHNSDDISTFTKCTKPRNLQRISSGSTENSAQTEPATPYRATAKETFYPNSRLRSSCL